MAAPDGLSIIFYLPFGSPEEPESLKYVVSGFLGCGLLSVVLAAAFNSLIFINCIFIETREDVAPRIAAHASSVAAKSGNVIVSSIFFLLCFCIAANITDNGVPLYEAVCFHRYVFTNRLGEGL